jgi:cobalt/nickel transport system permease protein
MGGTCIRELALTGTAGRAGSPVHRLDPRAKLLGLAAVTVVAVTTPLSAWPVYVACAAVLAAVLGVARIRPRDVLRRVRPVLLLVVPVVAVVPFVRTGGATFAVGPLTAHEAGLAVLAGVTAKTTLGACSAALLTLTTSYADVLRGLEALRAPRTLVLIATLMYRYLFLIVAEVQRMRAALAARAYRPRSVARAGTMGRVATALFLRSYERGERVHLAMLARGFDGRMPRGTTRAWHRADATFLLLVLVCLVPLRVALGRA